MKSVEELSRLAGDAEARVERRVLELINLGSTHRAWTREARAELFKIGMLTVLPPDELTVKVYNGSVMIQNALTRLAESDAREVEILLRGIETLTEDQQAALYAGVSGVELVDDQVIEMLRTFLEEHTGNTDVGDGGSAAT